MIRYLGRRLLNYAALLFVAVSLTWVLAATQLNPRALFQLRQPPIDPEVIENQLLRYNLSENVPLVERYWTWLSGVLRGDWGYSPLGVSVAEEISTRMWVSLRLLLIGTLLGILLGVAFGAWTATRQYRVSDRVVTGISLLIISTPAFVIGHVTQIGATWLNNLTQTRMFEFIGETGEVGDYPLADLVDRAQHLLLPTLVLIVLGAASMSRIQRNLMLERLQTIPGIHVTKPNGTFYCFPDFSAYMKDSQKLAELLLARVRVVTVPGKEFGMDGHLRLSYSGSVKEIIEAVDRMKWALDPNAPNEIYIGDRKCIRDWM